MIETVRLDDLPGTVTDVAVMVTDPPVGTEGGAVYFVASELFGVVTIGLNEPQLLEPQVTVQLNPAPLVSLRAVAVKNALAPVIIDVDPVIAETLIGSATIGNMTLLLAAGSPVTVAIIVTVAPAGMVEGPV